MRHISVQIDPVMFRKLLRVTCDIECSHPVEPEVVFWSSADVCSTVCRSMGDYAT